MRQTGFPFDWLLVPHEGLLALLYDDFDQFLEERYFCRDSESPMFMVNWFYQIEFFHDSPIGQIDSSHFKEHLAHIQDKYARRIERFRKLRTFRGTVVFIRSHVNDIPPFWRQDSEDPSCYWCGAQDAWVDRLQAEKLHRALRCYFPDLDFTLVVVNRRRKERPPPPSFPSGEGIYFFEINEGESTELISNILLCNRNGCG